MNAGLDNSNVTPELLEKKNKSLMDLSLLGRKILSMKFEKKAQDHEFTINDLNNYVGADRKVVVNDSYEFWVHDAALIKSSNYFVKNLLNSSNTNLNSSNTTYPRPREDTVKTNDMVIKKMYIYVPHPEYFFDILTWIYSKDAHRLSLAADEPESFLCILNLGIFLEMSDDFFKTLLETCEIKLDEELLVHNLWSRFSFTFEVLTNLLNLMPKDNYFLKICALLSWLKEDNTAKNSDTNDTIKEKEFEVLTSKDFFLVKNFLTENKLLNYVNVGELTRIREQFPNLIPALDTNYLVEKYIVKPNLRISCRVCKKVT
jgi:hypothetical protein